MIHPDTDMLRGCGITAPRPVAAATTVVSPVACTPDGPVQQADLSALPPPAPPRVQTDARTVQAMASWEHELAGFCASRERWAAAQDVAHAAALRNVGADSDSDPALAAMRDGGLHYFMRLRLQEDHSGAAALRRLALGAMRAQQRHLDDQERWTEAARAVGEKMKPLLARVQVASMLAHTFALATGCAVGAALTAGAATSGAMFAAGALTLGVGCAAVAGTCAVLGMDVGSATKRAAAGLNAAAAGGLLLMTGAQAVNPWLAPALAGSRLVDFVGEAAVGLVEQQQQAAMREAMAMAHMARLMGTVHDRGYNAGTDGVQRLNQAHSRVLGIINAILRSNQQVQSLQIRNLRR